MTATAAVEDRDDRFEAAARIARVEPPASDWIQLAILAVIIVIAVAPRSTAVGIVAVIVALVLQDVGQWVSMKLLHHGDPSVLFLPFLRRSLPPPPARFESYKQGIVYLLGPVPGAALAFWLSVAFQVTGMVPLGEAAMVVASVSAFGLLPLAQVDGGRLLDLVLFCRHPIAEALFLLVTSAAMVALGLWGGLWLLVAVGALGVLLSGRRHKVASAARRVRGAVPGMPHRVSDVDEPGMRALYAAANALVPENAQERADREGFAKFAPLYAAAMRDIHRRAAVVPPSLRATLLLLGLYAVGVLAAAVALVMAALVI